jgi:hypothetical protein
MSTSASRPAGLTVARTNCVSSTSGSSPTAVGRASSSAPWPTTAATARWSTTSLLWAGGSRRPEPASPCMSAAKAPGSPPSAPTTTSTRRRAGTSGNEVE